MAVAPFGLGVTFYAKDKLSPVVSRLRQNFDKFTREMGISGAELDAYNIKMQKLSSTFNKFYIAGGYTQVFYAMGQGMLNAARQAKVFGDTLLTAAADFETVQNKLKVATKANAAQMKVLEDNAYKVGMATQYSWTEALEAERLLVSKGFDLKSVLDQSNDSLLRSVVYLGEASGKTLSLADSADLVTSAMVKFGLKGSVAVRNFTNQMAAMVNMGVDLKDMKSYFQSATALPGGLGAKQEEMLAFLAAGKQAGLSPKKAGIYTSSFASDILAIQKRQNLSAIRGGKLAPLAALFQQTGIKLWDKKGNVPFTEVVAQLLAKIKGGGAKDAINTLGILNKTGQAFILMMEKAKVTTDKGDVFGIDALRENIRKLDPNNLTGLAEKISKMQRKSIAGIREFLSSTWESLKVIFGKSYAKVVLPLLSGLAQKLEDLGTVMLKYPTIPDFLMKLGLSLAGFAAIAGALTVLGTSIQLLNVALMSIGSLKGMIQPLWKVLGSPGVAEVADVVAGAATGGAKGVGKKGIKGSVTKPSVWGDIGGYATSRHEAKVNEEKSRLIKRRKVLGNIYKQEKIAMADDLNKHALLQNSIMSKNAIKNTKAIDTLEKKLATRESVKQTLKNLPGAKSKAGRKHIADVEAQIQTLKNRITKRQELLSNLPIVFERRMADRKILKTRELFKFKESLGISALNKAYKDLGKLSLLQRFGKGTLGVLLSIGDALFWIIKSLSLLGIVALTAFVVWKTGLFGIKDLVVNIYQGIMKASSIAADIMSGDAERITKSLKKIYSVKDKTAVQLGEWLGTIGVGAQGIWELLGSTYKDRNVVPREKYGKYQTMMAGAGMMSQYNPHMVNMALMREGLMKREKVFTISGATRERLLAAGYNDADIQGFARFGEALYKLKNAMETLAKVFMPNGDLSKVLNDIFTDPKSAIGNFATNLTALVNELTRYIKWFSETMTWARDIYDPTKPNWWQTMSRISNPLLNALYTGFGVYGEYEGSTNPYTEKNKLDEAKKLQEQKRINDAFYKNYIAPMNNVPQPGEKYPESWQPLYTINMNFNGELTTSELIGQIKNAVEDGIQKSHRKAKQQNPKLNYGAFFSPAGALMQQFSR